ncbi:leucine--tRNA ligase [soil metagenome]
MNKYIPQEFEEQWAAKWEADGLFQKSYEQEGVTPENKKYLLFAFAYPSGSGLHVGHVESATALDILARYYRSIGKKVFFPVGWDAFGLPAENYAIKTGIPPEKTTRDAITTFSRQIKRVGISYDWSTEVATCHPGYYKWTQWLFLQLYKKELAYKKNAAVNWCPSCQTVLANEQVVDGKCERCGTTVVQKDMYQWFFKITDYKDELISGLEKVNWPHATKQQQLNWIGRKEGINIHYPVDSTDEEVICFTTRPDTNFGATFIVLAPEHELVKKIVDKTIKVDDKNRLEIEKYVEYTKTKTEEERRSEGKKKTGAFTGLYAINRLNGKKLPIWISDFVLAGFGTGAVVGVPAHDIRDFQFAHTFDIPIIRVVSENGNTSDIISEDQVQEAEGTMMNSDFLNGLDIHTATEKIMNYLEEKNFGKRVVTYNLRDWLISRQRYWGAPIPVVYDPEGKAHPVKEEHLPWMLPTDVDFTPTGESPLRRSKEFIERVEKLYGPGWRPEYDTMDTFVDSSWYYLRYTDPRNEEEFAKKDHLQKWTPIDFYMIGPEHIVLHLLYSRFFTKFLRDEGYLSIDEPFSHMRHQGMILGPDNKKMSKSKGNVINPDIVIGEYGADTLRMYEMFMGPIESDKPWNETSVGGVYRFLQRIWRKYQQEYSEVKTSSEENKEVVIALNKTIDKVTHDIELLKFNTAISSMMIFINEWEPVANGLSPENAKKLLKILSPFAPFMTEELWHAIFNEKESIHLAVWPQIDTKALQDSTVTLPVQVGGKMRGTITVPIDSSEAVVIEMLQKDAKMSKYLVEGTYKKVIFVKNKILNIII